MKTIKAIKEVMVAYGYGIKIGLRWYIDTIQDEENYGMKIIYIMTFILDVILAPLKMLILTILAMRSYKVREAILDLYYDNGFDNFED